MNRYIKGSSVARTQTVCLEQPLQTDDTTFWLCPLLFQVVLFKQKKIVRIPFPILHEQQYYIA